MKNYFNFTLTGARLFPIWMLFLLLFLVPYVFLVFKMETTKPQGAEMLGYLFAILGLVAVAYGVLFYVFKLLIEGVSYKEQSLVFKGTFLRFLGKFLLGLFLSVITLGIYYAWFIRDMSRFFVDNTSCNTDVFQFKGKAPRLFWILLFSLIIPVVLLTALFTILLVKNPSHAAAYALINQLAMLVVLTPYIYLVYKWMVNVDYKGYNIRWETDFWNSCGKIALEMVLTVITLGIYGPMAFLRLYTYFAGKTVAVSEEAIRPFGFEPNYSKDFFSLWGQILLTVVTLGLYYPWAICKINTRILGKTYLVEKAGEKDV